MSRFFRLRFIHVQIFCWMFLCFSFSNQSVHAAKYQITLCKNNQAQQPIVISEKASEATQKVAADLAFYLKKMTGAEFQVTKGDGNAGIVLGRPDEFPQMKFPQKFKSGPFQREDYILRNNDQALYLLGASDLAVSHAAWDLLHRLGYRQFFPGETWEVIPTLKDIAVTLDKDESPDFYSRRIWYNWGTWGYNNQPYQEWCQRNRAVQGFKLNSGHAYGSILSANNAEFQKHPEYYAMVDGKRRTEGGDIKFCISNPNLRKLVADHAVKSIKANPTLDSVSMDPSDGGNWCECEACKKMGSISDRALLLANEVSQAINTPELTKAYGEKYVGMYAYNQHSPPPSIKADPHVIISATTAFLRGGYTFDQILEGWQAQGATMGVYDYLSVVAWDWNLPRGAKGGRLASIQHSIPKFHKQGARFYDAESGDCWGPCGLGYYLASRLMWDVDEAAQTDAIIEDFLDKAFGNAKEPMREFYRIINQDNNRRGPADIIGRMYRSLEAAQKATDDAKVQARINDLILYTRYAEIYYAYQAKKTTKEEVARHAYRMRKTMMVHSYGLWARLVGQKAAHTKDHPLKNEEPFTSAELDKYLKDGIANNVPVDPGFEGAIFSDTLIPAAKALKLPTVTTGFIPTQPQDFQRFYVWLEEDKQSIDIKIRVKKRWENRQPKLALFSPQDVKIEPFLIVEDYKPDNQIRELQLKTPYSGLHRIETLDGGDYTYITWPENMPVTLESGIDTPRVTSQFRGPWSMYFYVPKGTKVVGGWASRIANWAPRISGKMLDGSGKEVFDFGKVDEGWFKVEVPSGEDGKLWKFDHSQGQRLLMTVPPYLACNAEELLLPKEVVEKDQAK